MGGSPSGGGGRGGWVYFFVLGGVFAKVGGLSRVGDGVLYVCGLWHQRLSKNFFLAVELLTTLLGHACQKWDVFPQLRHPMKSAGQSEIMRRP